jgi:hypothetical protein
MPLSSESQPCGCWDHDQSAEQPYVAPHISSPQDFDAQPLVTEEAPLLWAGQSAALAAPGHPSLDHSPPDTGSRLAALQLLLL